ncbi:formimidoylglutamate deiminase [Nocardioides ferulae]|uniref:formimidoylglutamate deiminase n=1 Tax=Nocardioides ferulae TaxID=2340821 RepID=UPI001F0BE26C|nr:formimidoylglutamate deiminase [Nocardioides ferulae]
MSDRVSEGVTRGETSGEPAGARPGGGAGSAYLLERAWVGGAVRDDVLVTIADGVFTSVTPGIRNPRIADEASLAKREFHRPGGETPVPPTRLPGLTLPGLANCHSHAFHRALRGRTQRGGGTFWTWREQMYDVAGRLDPDSLFALARATYREMAAAGVTSVGEFHYLHHGSDGTPYDDPNTMGAALVAAADAAGVRLCLLDTCYLSSGFGEPPQGVQRRFADRDVDAWAERAAGLGADLVGRDGVVVGAAAHSVRAVPRSALPVVAGSARATGRPLHVHVSEQVAENDACHAAYGLTPTQVLAEAGALGPRTTAVHATHLTGGDVALLGASGTHACLCPTTERDLGDGIGPARALHEAGSPLTLGSDSHAVIDLFEEARAVELDERLATRRRGHFSAGELLAAATVTGHRSLGFDDAGEIAPGRRADLVVVSLDGPATAGTGADEHTAVFAATVADVVQVMVDGRWVVAPGDRAEVARELTAAVAAVWEE